MASMGNFIYDMEWEAHKPHMALLTMFNRTFSYPDRATSLRKYAFVPYVDHPKY